MTKRDHEGSPAEGTTEERLRRTEQALRESEQRYRMLVESQGEGIGIVDGDERFIYANPAAERIFGLRPGTMVGKTLHELLDPGQLAAALAQTERRRAGSRDTYELKFTSGDGERRTLLVTATPRYDGTGAYLGAFGVFRDITARKQMEDALREQEERYRQLVESLPHGMALLQRGTTVFANQAALAMLGLESLEQVTALHPAEMLAPGERERVMGLLAGLRSGQERGPVHYITRARRADGGEFPVEAFVTAISYRGQPALQLFMMDIGDRVEAERERMRLEEQLHQAQRLQSIGRLAGGIAHDFNNLLSPILLYAELALQGMDPGAEHFEEFTEISQAVRQAKHLTQQLLAFGRRQVLQTKVLDLNDVVYAAHKLLRRLIREDVAIELDLDPALGSVKADPAQLQQVLMNLALNARDSMPEGGRMTLRSANVSFDDRSSREHAELPPGPYVMLEVSDTGRGMAPETLGQIFEPFFTTKATGKGTGLGLASVHGIVKQHGGQIEVTSDPGRGTTFVVYLPRVDDTKRRSLRPAPPDLTTPMEGTVLLAEDDEQVRAQVQRILGQFGLVVLVAEDGEDAVAQAARHGGPIDLLVTDVVMPRMNGRQLYERLRATRPDLAVVYMSGYPDDVIADQAGLGEDVRFLQKPFSLEALLEAVREGLEGPEVSG